MAPTLVRDVSAIHARQGLAHLLKARETQLSALAEKYWVIIGSGSVGAKAEELMRKTWAIERAGFDVDLRAVFAMGFFENYKRTGKFNAEEMAHIRSIAERFKGKPLAVRSSAHGDCRGTGIYESTFIVFDGNAEANTDKLTNAMRFVLDSEKSDKSREFRRVNNLPEGMAVIVEPVFGEKKALDNWAPDYGGFGYTSTSSGKGYVSFRPGLPTLPVNGQGIIVYENENTKIIHIVLSQLKMVKHGTGSRTWYQVKKTVNWIKEGEAVDLEYGTTIHVSLDDKKYLRERKLDWIFDKMKRLEELLGKPQYIEWAVVFSRGVLSVRVVQIADVDIKTDAYEFCESSRTVAKSTCVFGTGDLKPTEFVWLDGDSESFEELLRYNRANRAYVVAFWGDIIASYKHATIGFEHISNASVLVERVTGKPHTQSLTGHFGGALETSGIIALSTAEFNEDLLAQYAHKEYAPFKFYQRWKWWARVFGEPKREELYPHLKIYKVPLHVLASEKQQKAVVEIIECTLL